jgi:biopolymer transport protein ExbD
MAKRKPSERRNFQEEGMELDLTPMMNLIAILIPALLVSTVFIEIAVVNVAAPAIGSAPQDDQPQDKPDKPPLNLTVTVTDQGYSLTGSGGPIGTPSGGDQKGPTIPVLQRATSCQSYLGTVPPPRPKNKEQKPCEDPEEVRQFWVYDVETLQKKFVEIKDAFPDEVRVIIAAEQKIEFEAITDVMDAGREVKDPGGEIRELFPEVVLSPGLS